MFTCLTVTLRKTVIKPNFAKILRFSLKKGGSQAGVYPISTLRVSMDTPAFDPPFFNSENAKLPLNWVFQLLSATVTVKQVNKELFPHHFTLKKDFFVNVKFDSFIRVQNTIRLFILKK